MKRREFNSLTVSTLALIMLPKVPYRKPVDFRKWFEDNRYWLNGWLKNHKTTSDCSGMSIFRTPIRERIKEKDYETHRDIILFSAVFSRGNVLGAHCMSGFLEQKGRLPVKNDNIHFEYFKQRWFRFFSDIDVSNVSRKHEFFTQCRLLV